ncbi:hypothetical protein K8I31_03535, partial [bacterium]|nr:hypothetical protein [bacterium]
ENGSARRGTEYPAPPRQPSRPCRPPVILRSVAPASPAAGTHPKTIGPARRCGKGAMARKLLPESSERSNFRPDLSPAFFPLELGRVHHP